MRTVRRAVMRAALISAIAAWPASRPARAQQAPSVFSDVTRAAWYDVNSLLLSAARKMPQEHYAFRPVKDTRTFAEIVGHLVGEHYAICGALTGRPLPVARFEQLTKKEELVGVLQGSIELCDLAYGLLTDENAAFRYTVFGTVGTRLSLLTSNIAHDNEHYGSLAIYMRINGVMPPSGGQ